MPDERVFTMPDLGEGLDEGEIVAWRVAEGETVELNQPLVEIETAKAAVEVPSPVAGVVASLHGSPGDAIAVGAPLVTFAGAGPEAREPSSTDDAATGASVRSTPPVRKLAKELGVELAGVAGSGPQGRITVDDVRAAANGEPRPMGRPGRSVIARALERQAAVPQVTTFRTLDCTTLEDLRASLGGVSPLPIVVAALCRTVAAHPTLNAAWVDGEVVDRAEVHVGIAADTARGLVVPVVRDAAGLGIGELATEIGRLANAARSGALEPEDLRGATIAVSNTGSYGSEAGTPILSPGTSVTLAIGVIAPRALVVDGQVVARPACTLSCTFDHRVLDGAAVGRALTELVGLLSSPQRSGALPR
jgi:2-oxoisovalerate dehydrogenase E2 component (dihydrolipoyl transacylase)